MSSEYNKLIEKLTDEIFINSGKLTRKAFVQQKRHLEDLLNQISKSLLIFTIADNALSLPVKEVKKLRNQFAGKIMNIVKEEFKVEKNLMNDILSLVTKDKYYTNAYVMDMGLNFNLNILPDEKIKIVVDGALKGEVWSDRLWKNKKELEVKLNKEINHFLMGETSVNDIEKAIRSRFNQNAYNTNRLVQTEVSRCQDEANDIFAEEHGLEFQIYTATLDEVTSDFCRAHDGKVYKVDDPLKPRLPAHPFCRSCYINQPDEEWQPEKRRNNENGKIVNYSTYQVWYKDKIDKRNLTLHDDKEKE